MLNAYLALNKDWKSCEMEAGKYIHLEMGLLGDWTIECYPTMYVIQRYGNGYYADIYECVGGGMLYFKNDLLDEFEEVGMWTD